MDNRYVPKLKTSNYFPINDKYVHISMTYYISAIHIQIYPGYGSPWFTLLISLYFGKYNQISLLENTICESRWKRD